MSTDERWAQGILRGYINENELRLARLTPEEREAPEQEADALRLVICCLEKAYDSIQ